MPTEQWDMELNRVLNNEAQMMHKNVPYLQDQGNSN